MVVHGLHDSLIVHTVDIAWQACMGELLPHKYGTRVSGGVVKLPPLTLLPDSHRSGKYMCFHMWVTIITRLMNQGATRVNISKVVFTPANRAEWTDKIYKKVGTCQSAPPFPFPGLVVEPPIDTNGVDLQTGGEPSPARYDFISHVVGFYLLEEICHGIDKRLQPLRTRVTVPRLMVHRAADYPVLSPREATRVIDGWLLRELHTREYLDDRTYRTIVSFNRVYKQYTVRFARMIFDYLALACLGEGRHIKGNMAKHNLPKWYGGHTHRRYVFNHGTSLDPRIFLPTLQYAFREFDWESSFGGEKWARVVQAALEYFKYCHDQPEVYIDYIINTTHNGGLVWDKLTIFSSPHAGTLKAILDIKKTESLIAWNPSDSTVERLYPAELEPTVLAARALRLIPNWLDYDILLTPVEQASYTPIGWGRLPLYLHEMPRPDLEEPDEETQEDPSQEDQEDQEDSTPTPPTTVGGYGVLSGPR